MMKKLLLNFCLVISLAFISVSAYALDFGAQVPPDPTAAIPIDGGLSWLLAAGGIYGVSKLRKNLKK